MGSGTRRTPENGWFYGDKWRMISDILIHHTGRNSNLITNLITIKELEKRQEMKKNKIAFMTNWILSKDVDENTFYNTLMKK